MNKTPQEIKDAVEHAIRCLSTTYQQRHHEATPTSHARAVMAYRTLLTIRDDIADLVDSAVQIEQSSKLIHNRARILEQNAKSLTAASPLSKDKKVGLLIAEEAGSVATAIEQNAPDVMVPETPRQRVSLAEFPLPKSTRNRPRQNQADAPTES